MSDSVVLFVATVAGVIAAFVHFFIFGVMY